MGQIRHGSATTTHAIRAAIQRSQASLAVLSKEFGINAKTVAKWRKRTFVDDLKTGPTKPRSTVLTEAEEAMIVAFRRHTLLPLDDCLYALQSTLPHLTRSALHRCLQRRGISRLPDVGVTSRLGSGSSVIQSASFTLISLRFRQQRGSYICSLPLTAPASSPSPNSQKRRIDALLGSFCSTCWKLCPTKSTPF